jgi:quinol monooxygenase YgiN
VITLTAEFTMRKGREAGALRLVAAVKRQSEREQPGTLVYLVHRVLDKRNRPTRTLLFYERYRSPAALQAHLRATSWQAIEQQWRTYFEGSSWHTITSTMLTRIAAFERRGAIPVSKGTGRGRG